MEAKEKKKRRSGGGRKPHLEKKRVLIMMDKELHSSIKERGLCLSDFIDTACRLLLLEYRPRIEPHKVILR